MITSPYYHFRKHTHKDPKLVKDVYVCVSLGNTEERVYHVAKHSIENATSLKTGVLMAVPRRTVRDGKPFIELIILKVIEDPKELEQVISSITKDVPTYDVEPELPVDPKTENKGKSPDNIADIPF